MGSSSNVITADFLGSPGKLSDEAREWLRRERKISRETLAKLPVGSVQAWFPDLGKRSDAVCFRYRDGWKARAYPEKAFTQKKGNTAAFWNLRAVLNGKLKRVYVTEGELDACALVEAGIDASDVISAPSAAVGELQYVEDAIVAGLNKAAAFVWCGDADDAGKRLRAAMAHALGVAHFHFVEWPEGIKDANEMLAKDGPADLLDRVQNGAEMWPAEGLYTLDKIPDRPPLTLWEPGFEEWKDRMWLAAGTLSVATGHPGHGKTSLWTQIWYQVARQYDLVTCIASFETRPKPHLRRQLRTLITGKLERYLLDPANAALGYPKLVRDADQWIKDHYLFMIHKERQPSLEWVLDQAAIAVLRHKVKVLQIDPWNRLEASRESREMETEYIARCLKVLYNFAVDFDCHVQIIAHPAKMEGFRRGHVPELEDISGSKNWDNMVDQGWVIHRPKLFDDKGNRETYAELHYKKARFDELGYATKFGLRYDFDYGKFVHADLPKTKRKNGNNNEVENEEEE